MEEKDKGETRRKRRAFCCVGKAPADFKFCKRSIANPRLEFRLCHWLVRRLRGYRKTPRSSIDSLAVLACLASHRTPVFNAACDLKLHQASPPAFCLTRRSWPSSWRLVDAWTLGSEALSVHGRGRATKAALSDCSFACWRHAINPAHPSRRQKEKNALSDPVICRSSLWRRPSKACFDNPYHQDTRGTEVKDISIVKSTASESGAGATDCEMQ